MNPLNARSSRHVQPRAARLASRLLAASLAVAPCLVWGVDPQASMRFDNPAVGPAFAFATGHATPAGRTFADAVADPRTTAIEASAFGQSKADAHAAPTSFARGFAMTEAAASVDIATPVTAVPEPRTYVLMLVGLGALVFVARRRRRVE